MDLGTNLKRLRIAQNYTQKDLADQLNVTAQAVSRWENNEVEPSLDMLNKISTIFSVTFDELMNGQKAKGQAQNTAILANGLEAGKQIYPIGVCEQCNKPIMEGQPIHRISAGRQGKHIYCEICNEKQLANQKNERVRLSTRDRRRGLGWGIPAGLITLAIGIAVSVSQSTSIGDVIGFIFLSIAVAYAVFALVFCSLANNNFVGDWFVNIASWGFVRMPGIIFGLSLEGIFWLLTVKLFLFLLGISLALAAFLLAIVICAPIAIFVFPFSIRWSYKNPEKNESFL